MIIEVSISFRTDKSLSQEAEAKFWSRFSCASSKKDSRLYYFVAKVDAFGFTDAIDRASSKITEIIVLDHNNVSCIDIKSIHAEAI